MSVEIFKEKPSVVGWGSAEIEALPDVPDTDARIVIEGGEAVEVSGNLPLGMPAADLSFLDDDAPRPDADPFGGLPE